MRYVESGGAQGALGRVGWEGGEKKQLRARSCLGVTDLGVSPWAMSTLLAFAVCWHSRENEDIV